MHRKDMLRHYNNECGSQARFECPYCKNCIRRRSHAWIHIRSLHAGKEFYCRDIVTDTFIRKGQKWYLKNNFLINRIIILTCTYMADKCKMCINKIYSFINWNQEKSCSFDLLLLFLQQRWPKLNLAWIFALKKREDSLLDLSKNLQIQSWLADASK